MVVERKYMCTLTTAMMFFGAFWLAMQLYLLLSVGFFDISSLILKKLNKDTGFLKGKTSAVMIFLTAGLITLFGSINASIPRYSHYEIHIPKTTEIDTLTIASLSDLHLSTVTTNRKLRAIVEKTNAANPDIIFIAGDIIDNLVEPVRRKKQGDILKSFDAPMGVWASTGNHEYIGGVQSTVKYLEQFDINFLRDEYIMYDSLFYIIGREDLDKLRFTDIGRKSLEEVLEGINHDYPTFLIDHQPVEYQEVVDAKIDFKLSGHTHAGQMFPFQYVTSRIHYLNWGHIKKGYTHIFVTAGAGTWGPPVKTVGKSEIMIIDVIFD